MMRKKKIQMRQKKDVDLMILHPMMRTMMTRVQKLTMPTFGQIYTKKEKEKSEKKMMMATVQRKILAKQLHYFADFHPIDIDYYFDNYY